MPQSTVSSVLILILLIHARVTACAELDGLVALSLERRKLRLQNMNMIANRNSTTTKLNQKKKKKRGREARRTVGMKEGKSKVVWHSQVSTTS